MATTLQTSANLTSHASTTTAMRRTASVVLLRTCAVVYALFTLGHTLGGMLGDTHRGARQAELFAAMRAYTFEVQGFTRSYWDFFRGFGFMTSVLLALAAALCWTLADIGRSNPLVARRVLAPLGAAMALVTWFSFVDFFGGPMVFSVAAVVLLAAAFVALGREGKGTTFGGTSR